MCSGNGRKAAKERAEEKGRDVIREVTGARSWAVLSGQFRNSGSSRVSQPVGKERLQSGAEEEKIKAN